MKRSLLIFTWSAFLVFGAALQAQQTKPGAEKSPAPERARGGLVTLYALDPLSRSLCLRDGREGMVIQNNRWGNRCSDLSYSLAGGGSLTSGLEASRVAVMIDLGSANELRERYGYEDADNGGVGFASLELQGNRIVILKEDSPTEELQPLREGPALFGEAGPSANAPVKLGHIYLVRLTDKTDSKYQLIAKVMVVAYRPEESVTLRWALL